MFLADKRAATTSINGIH